MLLRQLCHPAAHRLHSAHAQHVHLRSLASDVSPVLADGVDDLPFYSQFPLDRQADRRRDAQYLAELWSDPAARLVPLAADKVLVQPRAREGASSLADTQPAAQPGHPQDHSYPKLRPVLLRPAAAAAAALTAPGATPTFLGKDAAGVPYFALELADAQAALHHLPQFQLPPQQPHQAPQPTQPPHLPTEQQAAQAPTGADPPLPVQGDEQLAAASSPPCPVPPPAPGPTPSSPTWMSARLAGPDLAPSDAALLAVAAAYAQWHAANRFSAATGAPTTAVAGGAGRRCSSSRASVYPRIDPAVIMLVTAEGGRQASREAGHKGAAALAEDWALLGRKAEWPPGRYSTLAGFLEVGEPLELAVARETEEESGVRVELGSVTYAASQPWPFPRSLMIGFFASAAPLDRQHAAPLGLQPQQGRSSSSDSSRGSTGKGYELLSHEGRRAAMDVKLTPQEVDRVLCDGQLPALQVDHRELEDCRWFHRDWLHACLLGPKRGQVPGQADFHVPGPWSLAHRLIHTWLDARDTAPGAAGPTNTDLLSLGQWSGEEVPQVAIDVGTFKYVLMRLSQAVEGEAARSKLLVWGDCRAAYHMHVFQSAKAVARRLGLVVEVLGGGRIAHTPERRSIAIYGYSAAFGPAPHEVTAALVRKWFPLYRAEDITVSYEGY